MLTDSKFQTLRDLIAKLGEWTPQQRKEFIECIDEEFCRHCGNRRPIGLTCQCNNDE